MIVITDFFSNCNVSDLPVSSGWLTISGEKTLLVTRKKNDQICVKYKYIRERYVLSV